MYWSVVALVLASFNSSWAGFPCDPLDSATTCCGASGDWKRHDTLFSVDLGICDTLYVEPCPHTDTCFAGDCVNYKINNPGEHFPCFLYVHLFVTHDSNTFWWGTVTPKWVQDSIAAFITPLLFWHQPEGCADSVIFPFGTNGYQGINNLDISPYYPWMNKSIFRHFVNPQNTSDTTHNRMLQMVQNFKAPWNVYTDIDPHSSDGDWGHVHLGVTTIQQNCQRWWEGSKVLLATLTFQVYMPEDCDTTEICFDSVLWPPWSNLTFTRTDAKLYVPRHELPICFRLYDDTVEIVSTDVRWIEDFTEEDQSKPTSFSVSQNYPNPFNPTTNFRFTLPWSSHVKIEIFNILGQKVKTLIDKDMKAGVYLVEWDGKDERGVDASSGIYFYRIIAGEFSDIRKMVLLK